MVRSLLKPQDSFSFISWLLPAEVMCDLIAGAVTGCVHLFIYLFIVHLQSAEQISTGEDKWKCILISFHLFIFPFALKGFHSQNLDVVTKKKKKKGLD